tara:strand:- start:979 stop:1158 length:180 start_codon:yes stop_codon:yes gene_type:complete
MLANTITKELPAELWFNIMKYLSTPTAVIMKQHIINVGILPWEELYLRDSLDYSSNDDY